MFQISHSCLHDVVVHFLVKPHAKVFTKTIYTEHNTIIYFFVKQNSMNVIFTKYPSSTCKINAQAKWMIKLLWPTQGDFTKPCLYKCCTDSYCPNAKRDAHLKAARVKKCAQASNKKELKERNKLL